MALGGGPMGNVGLSIHESIGFIDGRVNRISGLLQGQYPNVATLQRQVQPIIERELKPEVIKLKSNKEQMWAKLSEIRIAVAELEKKHGLADSPETAAIKTKISELMHN
jgi:hypothetical protein